MLYKKSNNEFTVVVIHVDDCYMIGSKQSLEEVVKLIEEKGLKVKVESSTKDYLSCEIIFNSEKTKAWIGQPHLIKKLENKFKDIIGSNQFEYMTPGTPGLNIVRPKTEEEQVSPEDQKLFRSGVGTLLHFIKYSRPDISNTVRELSKCMDKATPLAFKEMVRLMKFVLNTREFGLKIEPKIPNNEFNFQWDMVMYTDSDWAGDKENRRSVSGYVIFLLGVPILWKSKLQKSVSLSSSEAEYYALSEAAKELKFIVQILKSLEIEIVLPIIVNVDNVGAIFMSENLSATARTKHVDMRYHFIREFIEDGWIKIQFVKTEMNVADMFTKNVNGEVYHSHVENFIQDRKSFFNG
jgi:hypothetical protein